MPGEVGPDLILEGSDSRRRRAFTVIIWPGGAEAALDSPASKTPVEWDEARLL
jgi:hypothetical protein